VILIFSRLLTLRSRLGNGLFRIATVSTYIVKFLLFLAEYFWWYAFGPMFIGLRREFVKTPAFLHSRLGQSLLPNRDREGVTMGLLAHQMS
jgi:hypothetical protein